MTLVVALDPGTDQTAYAVYDPATHDIAGHGILPNAEMLEWVRGSMARGRRLAVEMIASYGMPVGREVFQTCVWIGRFVEAWESRQGTPATYVYRRDVKLHLCGSARAKDANVRQAILDSFPRYGGGKVRQVGTKAKPGPLYGVSRDVWAAIGVALTYAAEVGERC